MNLGRIFTQGFVRKLGYMAAALVVAGVMSFCGKAHAYEAADQGEAYIWVNSKANANVQCAAGDGAATQKSGATRQDANSYDQDWECKTSYGSIFYTGLHASYSNTCAARNGQGTIRDVAEAYSPPATCFGGCKMQGQAYSYSNGGVMVYGMRDRSYNGDACQRQETTNEITQPELQAEREEPTKEKAPECNALGNGQTSCIKPNGDHCATASTGKTFCWTPNETGNKTDASDAQVKGEVNKPVIKPDVLIPDTDWQRREGHQQTACVNNTCITYNVTNFSQVPGTGTAQNSTGNNNPDGTGNTSGNGKPAGPDGEDDGDGDAATDSGNCDTAPACSGNTLQCLNNKFQWKIQCNTNKDKITNGNSCSADDIPVCIGKGCNAAEYAGMLQMWRARCEVQADRDRAGSDAASGDADAAGDDLEGVKGGLWAGDGVTPTFDRGKVSVGGGALFPDVPLGDGTWSAPPELYSSLDKIKVLVIAAFMIWGFFVLWKN